MAGDNGTTARVADDDAADAGARRRRAAGPAVRRRRRAAARRRRLPRPDGVQRRRHHLPPARLLGPHRPGRADRPHRRRLGHPAAVLLPRHPAAQGDQATARRRRLAAADPHRGPPPARARHRRPDPRHVDERRRQRLRVPFAPTRSSTCSRAARASSASPSAASGARSRARCPTCRASAPPATTTDHPGDELRRRAARPAHCGRPSRLHARAGFAIRVALAKVAVAATVARESRGRCRTPLHAESRPRAGAEGANPPRNLSGTPDRATGTLERAEPSATTEGEGSTRPTPEGAFR